MRVSDYSANQLRHLVRFERENVATRIPDGQGGYTGGWELVAEVMGNLAPQNARESVFAQRLEVVTSHRFVMRYGPAIDETMRLDFHGRLMNVRAVIDVEERNRWLVVFLDEGVVT
jgi:SPP1 family predicted phage head-tail adaptor